MADSLRDQLLKSGIVKQISEAPRASGFNNRGKGGKPPQAAAPRASATQARAASSPRANGPARSAQEIDLARAYAIRAQTDASERKRAEREAAERARRKRESKQKIQQLLEGQVLNKAEAELARHFEYGGKIRRVHVDADQLAALNAGQLGVVQQAGRYRLVNRVIAEQVRTIDAQQLALLIEPSGNGIGDDGVPDDLMW